MQTLSHQFLKDQSLFGGLYNQTGVFDTTGRHKKADTSPIPRRNSADGIIENGEFYVPSMDLIAETHVSFRFFE